MSRVGERPRLTYAARSLKAHAWPVGASIIVAPAELASSPSPSHHPLISRAFSIPSVPSQPPRHSSSCLGTSTSRKLSLVTPFYRELFLFWIPGAFRVMAHGLVPTPLQSVCVCALASNHQLDWRHSKGRAYVLGHLPTPSGGNMSSSERITCVRRA